LLQVHSQNVAWSDSLYNFMYQFGTRDLHRHSLRLICTMGSAISATQCHTRWEYNRTCLVASTLSVHVTNHSRWSTNHILTARTNYPETRVVHFKLSASTVAALACLPFQSLAAPALISLSSWPLQILTSPFESGMLSDSNVLSKRRCMSCIDLCAMGAHECLNAGCYKVNFS
jgi:hypothetical protein